MAAAAIPLIASLIPTLFPLGRSIVLGVEHLFGHGTGATKKQVATDMLGNLAKALATAGNIAGSPTTDDVANLIEVIVQELKSQGHLTGPALDPTTTPTTPTVLGSGNYKLAGTVVLTP